MVVCNVVARIEEDLKSPGEDIECLEIFDENTILTSSSSSGTVKIWDSQLNLIQKIEASDFGVNHLTSSSTSIFIASLDTKITEWQKIDGENWSVFTQLDGGEGTIARLCFYNGRLYSGDDFADIRIWEDGKLKGIINVVEEVWELVLHNNVLFTSRHNDVVMSEIVEGERISNARIRNVLRGKGPILPADEFLFIADSAGMNILVHDIKSVGNPLIMTLKGHNAMVNSFVYLGESKLLISGGWDKCLKVWDLSNKTSNLVTQVPTDGYINSIKLDKKGNFYAAGENGFLLKGSSK